MELKFNTETIKGILLSYYDQTENRKPIINISYGKIRTNASYMPPRIAVVTSVTFQTEQKNITQILSLDELLEKINFVLEKFNFQTETLDIKLDSQTNNPLFIFKGEKIPKDKNLTIKNPH